MGEVAAFCSAQVYRNVSPRAQWGGATTKRAVGHCKSKHSPPAGRPPSWAAKTMVVTVGFTGEAARRGGMSVGRPMFELWLYDSPTAWPWAIPTPQGCKAEQGDVCICVHTCTCVYFSTAWLIRLNWERSKVRNANTSWGSGTRLGSLHCWEHKKAND